MSRLEKRQFECLEARNDKYRALLSVVQAQLELIRSGLEEGAKVERLHRLIEEGNGLTAEIERLQETIDETDLCAPGAVRWEAERVQLLREMVSAQEEINRRFQAEINRLGGQLHRIRQNRTAASLYGDSAGGPVALYLDEKK
jgi:hypothetical protein